MKKYTVIAESKKQNIYLDTTESFTIEAPDAREAVRLGRQNLHPDEHPTGLRRRMHPQASS
jgi:hypothetical protein